MRRLLNFLRGLAAHLVWLLRPRLPWPIAERLLERRIRWAQGSSRFQTVAREQMEHLLAPAASDVEIAGAMTRYTAFTLREAELRWHPQIATNQRIEGIEHAIAARAEGRGVVMSFAHHAYYAGMFGALRRAGLPNGIVSGRDTVGWTVGPALRQHMRVVARGGELVYATEGTEGMIERLSRGEVLMIASDVPGGSRASFAGRTVKCSSGAVWAARAANSPIVRVATYRDADGPVVRISAPLYPADFADPQDLLQLLITHHEDAILQWPEATFAPNLCWQFVTE